MIGSLAPVLATLLASPPLQIEAVGFDDAGRDELRLRVFEAGWTLAGEGCSACRVHPIRVERAATRLSIRVAAEHVEESAVAAPVAVLAAAQTIDRMMRAQPRSSPQRAAVGLRFEPGVALPRRAALLAALRQDVASVGAVGRRAVCVARTDAGLRAWDGDCGSGSLIATDIRGPDMLRAALRTPPTADIAGPAAPPPPATLWSASVGFLFADAVTLTARSESVESVRYGFTVRGLAAPEEAAFQFGLGIGGGSSRYGVRLEAGAEAADTADGLGLWVGLPISATFGVMRWGLSPYFDTRRGLAFVFEVGVLSR